MTTYDAIPTFTETTSNAEGLNLLIDKINKTSHINIFEALLASDSSTTSNTYAVLSGMTTTMTTEGGDLFVIARGRYITGNTGTWIDIRVTIDGVEVQNLRLLHPYQARFCMMFTIPDLVAGDYDVALEYRESTGTGGVTVYEDTYFAVKEV